MSALYICFRNDTWNEGNMEKPQPPFAILRREKFFTQSSSLAMGEIWYTALEFKV